LRSYCTNKNGAIFYASQCSCNLARLITSVTHAKLMAYQKAGVAWGLRPLVTSHTFFEIIN